MNNPNYEKARTFFSAYFHEDWPEEAETAEEVVANYLAEGTAGEERRLLSQEIERFAAQYADDERLEHALFEDLGCYYRPRADNKSARVWLVEVSRALLA